MASVKRKRVTRVGSGAYSIYLPKKWIDGWLPEQQENREVDLIPINQSLLVTPVMQDFTLQREVPNQTSTVRDMLLSAYIRGMRDVQLTPPGGANFDNDCITHARDFLRHLDERLIATCTPETIGFQLQADMPPAARTGDDLARVMAAKVHEALALAQEAVETHAHDPDRTLHALALLRATQEEDIARLFHQTLRLVATIELPLQSVSDFQLLDLVASHLHRIGNHTQRTAQTILGAYKLTLDDLDYPRNHLLEQVGPPPATSTLATQLVRGHKRGYATARDILTRLMDALGNRDISALAALETDAHQARHALETRLFEVVVEHWGDPEDEQKPEAGFTAYQLAIPLADTLGILGVIARHAIALLAASPEAQP